MLPSAPILRCDNFIHYLVLMHRVNDTYILWGPGSYHLVVVRRSLFNNIRFFVLLYNLNFAFFCQYSFILYISSYSFPDMYTCHLYCNHIHFLICTLYTCCCCCCCCWIKIFFFRNTRDTVYDSFSRDWLQWLVVDFNCRIIIVEAKYCSCIAKYYCRILISHFFASTHLYCNHIHFLICILVVVVE